jgi:hypothetical protein
MKQYASKVSLVYALCFEYSDEGIQKLKDFVGDELVSYGKDQHPHAMGWAELGVVEQNHNLVPPAKHIVSEGDYIIKSHAGEFYPCKPDVFNENYAEINQDDK